MEDHASNGPDSMDTSGAGHGHSEDSWPVGDVTFPGDDSLPESYDFLLNASWGSKPQENAGTDLLYNDLFAPDTGECSKVPLSFSTFNNILTASSFNNPFTTANYYNWLFGNENWPDVDLDPAAIDPRFSMMGNANAVPQPPSSIDSRGFSVSNSSGKCSFSGLFPTGQSVLISTSMKTTCVKLSSDIRDLSLYADTKQKLIPSLDYLGTSGVYSNNRQQYEQPQFGYGIPTAASDYSTQSQDEPNPETSAANQILAMSKMAEYNLASSLGYNSVVSESPKNHQGPVSASPGFFPTPTTSGSGQELYSHPSQPKPIRKLPLVNETARQGVLGLIHRAGPKTPDGSEITADHPLLALPVLQEYCDLYFKRFNASYPLLHQATFEPASVDPLLLMSVLLLGATYDTKESHLVAVCIHDTLRAQIFGSVAFNTRPTLWVLQTILLVECFGKSRAGQMQHDMSHLFHGLLIK